MTNGDSIEANDDATRSALNELLFETLERLEVEGLSAVDAACAKHPALAGDLRRRLDELASTGLLPGVGAADPSPPERLGSLRIGDLLGRGGMGLVFEAQDTLLDAPRVVKMIRPEFAASESARQRLRREARAVARLRHPGIVAVHAVSEERGTPFVVLERIRGATLRQVLAALEGRDAASLTAGDLRRAFAESSFESGAGPPQLYEGAWFRAVGRVARDVAEALHHAHTAGVLHRDVKPSNVMITPGGRVVLTDFGLAHLADGELLTRPGALLGSLPYAPPERLSKDGTEDARGDVYGVGLLLFELLTLRPAFEARSKLEVIARIQRADRPALRDENPSAPVDLVRICELALAPDPADRYASAGALARDLSCFLEGLPLESRPRSVVVSMKEAWRRRRGAWAAGAAVAALVALGPPALLHREARAARASAVVHGRAEHHLQVTLDAIAALRRELRFVVLAEVPTLSGLRDRVLERALELYADLAAVPGYGASGGPRAAVLLELAEVELELGRRARAAKSLALARDLARSEGSALVLARCARLQHRLGPSPGDAGRLRVTIERGLASGAASPAEEVDLRLTLAELVEPGAARAELHRVATWIASRSGGRMEIEGVLALEVASGLAPDAVTQQADLEAALELLERAGARPEDRLVALTLESSLRAALAEVSLSMGDRDRARAHAEEALRAAELLAGALPASQTHAARRSDRAHRLEELEESE